MSQKRDQNQLEVWCEGRKTRGERGRCDLRVNGSRALKKLDQEKASGKWTYVTHSTLFLGAFKTSPCGRG